MKSFATRSPSTPVALTAYTDSLVIVKPSTETPGAAVVTAIPLPPATTASGPREPPSAGMPALGPRSATSFSTLTSSA